MWLHVTLLLITWLHVTLLRIMWFRELTYTLTHRQRMCIERKSGLLVSRIKSHVSWKYLQFFLLYFLSPPSHSCPKHTHIFILPPSSLSLTAAPPRHPPPFCEPFWGVMRLTCCPVLHRVMHCVFKQASSPESKFWSDKLLHEVNIHILIQQSSSKIWR